MTPITTIVHFSVPKANIDKFLMNWHKIEDIMMRQPGILDGVLHRCIDDDSPFQFVNVAHWESPEALANALRISAEEGKKQGVDVIEIMQSLGVHISQNNYVQEVKY